MILADKPKTLTFAPLSQKAPAAIDAEPRAKRSLLIFAEARKSIAHLRRKCGNSSVGRARPCQGRGREFESRLPLQIMNY